MSMTPRQKLLFDKAERERNQICNWLLELMAQSSAKPVTKIELCAIAQAKFGVSKNSFNAGWDLAILQSGNEHWWKPLSRSARTSKAVRN